MAAVKTLIPYQIEIAYAAASQKQLDFAEVFFSRTGPDGQHKSIFAAVGGNRSGKTYLACHMTFALYLRELAVDGDLFWCVCQNLDRSIGGQQKELWNALPRGVFIDGQVWDEKIGFGGHRKVILRTQDGGKCTVEFRSADQEASTFEQAKLRGVWVDERLPEEIFNRLLPRLIDLDGWIIYSDIPEQWWQWERLFCAKPDAGVHCVKFTMYDNAANLPAGAIDKARGSFSADMVSQKIMGEFMVMEGIVFKGFGQRHIKKPFAIPPYWPRWRLIDYGSSAYTACLWVAISEDERKYIYREHFDKGNGIPHNARCIIGASGAEEYRCTYMDPHAIDSPPAVYGMAPTVAKQYEMAGIKSVGWPYIQVMGEHACVERVKFALDTDRLFIFETCTNLIREFRSWKHKCDKEGKPLASDAYENGNNHGIDCCKGFLAANPSFTARKIEVVAA